VGGAGSSIIKFSDSSGFRASFLFSFIVFLSSSTTKQQTSQTPQTEAAEVMQQRGTPP